MSSHSNDDSHEGVGHVVGLKPLLLTAIALLILTGVTVGAAYVDFNKLDMPEMNLIVALSIATIKAMLVALFFMHLRWDKPFNAFVLVGSIAFVGLFMMFALLDSGEYQADKLEGPAPLAIQTMQEQGITP